MTSIMERPPISKEREVNEEETLFEHQLKTPEKIPFGTTSFDAWDIQPFREAAPKETPVLFVPGWGKTPLSYADGLREYAVAGRRILSLSFPTEDNTELADEISDSRFPPAQVNRARAILTLLDEKDVPRADVIAHSEGCMNAVIAQSMSPARFRHFVLMAPPGLTGKESYLEILKHFIKSSFHIREKKKHFSPDEWERYEQNKTDVKEWLKQRGLVKGNIEAMNPGRVEVDDLLRSMQSSGHGVSIIAGVDDSMLPIEKYQEENIAELGIDGFYSVKGEHDGPSIGEPEQYAHVAEQALEALEKKYELKSKAVER